MTKVYQLFILIGGIITITIGFISISEQAFAGCGKALLSPTNVQLIRGPKSGQIKLKWNPVVGATKYSVVYGINPNQYEYAISHFGDERTRSISIDYLKLNFKYYFRVQASDGCDYSPYSEEVSAWPPKRSSGVGMK